MTEYRDKIRLETQAHLGQIDAALAADREAGEGTLPTAQLANAKAIALGTLANLEHLDALEAASRDQHDQGIALLESIRRDTVAPADFGRVIVILGQVVSWLEDVGGRSSGVRFELDRSDRDTESSAQLLGFLGGDFYGADAPQDDQGPAPASPEWSRRPAPEPTLEDGSPVRGNAVQTPDA